MIELETRCTTCGHAFTPAPDAFRRGSWRACPRCRGDPGDEDSRTCASIPGAHRAK